jgi:hypothetical protein
VLSGTFDMEAKDGVVVISADAILSVGYDVTLNGSVQRVTILELAASGVMQIDERGFAGQFELSVITGQNPISDALGINLDVGIDATFKLIINTTKKDIEITMPLLSDDPGGTVDIAGSPDGGDLRSYVVVTVAGSLEIYGFTLEGAFYLEITEGCVEMSVVASVDIKIGSLDLISFTTKGVLRIDGSGVAGQLDLTVTDSAFENILKIDIDATFRLQVNTTSSEVHEIANESVDIPAGPIVRIEIIGSTPGSDPKMTFTDFDNATISADEIFMEFVEVDGALVVRGSIIGVSASRGGRSDDFANASFIITEHGLAIAATAEASGDGDIIPGLSYSGSATLLVNTSETIPIEVGTGGNMVLVQPGFEFDSSMALQITINGEVIFEIKGTLGIAVTPGMTVPALSGGSDGERASVTPIPYGENNDIVIRARDVGTALNGVVIVLENTVTAGNETVSYSSDSLTISISIEAEKTTAQQIVDAFDNSNFEFEAVLADANNGETSVDLISNNLTMTGGEDIAYASTTVHPREINNDLIITARQHGTGFDDVKVEFEYYKRGATSDEVVVTYDKDTKVLLIKIAENVTTAQDVVDAFNKINANSDFGFEAKLDITEKINATQEGNDGTGLFDLDA